ncbi:MAG: DUF1365 domain-containing protein [Actinomycetota bacterium]|nr:DUF1365 domain-containing protein [Actinomycetota bacterium]MDQ2957873.1 DUF1365 domain-containing protein [Actinomycetota bacterium]
MTGRPAGPVTPACYDVQISHRRRDPIDYGFAQRSSSWLIDLDDVPSLPSGLGWLCRFSSRDHLGDTRSTLRSNLNRFLAEHEVAAPARILMLANPRVLGYVFNPLSVFYCYDDGGTLAHTVAEVRNTYGGRHSYLFSTDPSGRAEVEKVFYVSPFYPVDGEYTMRLPEPGAKLAVTVTLNRPGDRPFVAALSGRRRPGRCSLWAALRSPLATRAVMFGIKRHGITLYFKGLRPFPRTAPSSELSEAR